jgi:ribonuclease HI
VVLRDPSGAVILELAKHFGRDTNNVAEYYGLLAALDYAVAKGIGALRIRSDSELLVRQMEGRYKVKSEDLRPLYERAIKLSRQLKYFAIEHVRREMNSEADALANVALDQAASGARAELRRERARPETHSSEVLPTGNATKTAPPAAATAASATAATRKTVAKKIRARFERGVLVPIDPTDLAEGTEVILEIRGV